MRGNDEASHALCESLLHSSSAVPWFGGRQIAAISRQDVQRWFASLRATLVAADRSAPNLSVILKETERIGHRPQGSNPCRGIRRCRREGRERYLSEEKLRGVARRLSAHQGERPLQVAAVRLLLAYGSTPQPGFINIQAPLGCVWRSLVQHPDFPSKPSAKAWMGGIRNLDLLISRNGLGNASPEREARREPNRVSI